MTKRLPANNVGFLLGNVDMVTTADMGRQGSRRPQRQYSPIGLNVRRRRAELDLTQQQVSDKSGLSVAHINMIEGGERKNLKAETLKKLAAALECTVDALTADPSASPKPPEPVPPALVRFLATGVGGEVTPSELEKLRGMTIILGTNPTVATYLHLLEMIRANK